MLGVHQSVRNPESGLGVLENQARTKTEDGGGWNKMFFCHVEIIKISGDLFRCWLISFHTSSGNVILEN